MRRLFSLSCVLLLTACSMMQGSVDLSRTYTNDPDGYTIRYPRGWVVTENDTLTAADYEVLGTSLVYPAQAEKTTLFDATFHIARVAQCPAQPNATTEKIGQYQWTKSPWSGAGAGNFYEGVLYTMLKKVAVAPNVDGTECIAVTFYLHSCNLGPDCGEDHSTPYDREKVMRMFEEMLETLILV